MQDQQQAVTKQRYTRQHYLQNLLEHVPHTAVMTFLQQQLSLDRSLYDEFMLSLGEHAPPDDLAEAQHRRTLSKMITRHLNPLGKLTDAAERQVLQAIEQLVDKASHPNTTAPQAINVCMATFSMLPDLGERMEDADERLYQLADTLCALLDHHFNQLNPTAQQTLFERLLREYAEPMYLDRDLDNVLLKLLKRWAKGKPDWQRACLSQQEQLLKYSPNDPWRKAYLLRQTRYLLKDWSTPQHLD